MFRSGFKHSIHRTFQVSVIALCMIMLSACSGSMEDSQSLASSKGSSGLDGNVPANPTPNPGDTPSPGDPGSSPGSGSGSGSGNTIGDGSGTTPAAPQVEILNINSSYLRGGITQDIIFRVTSNVGAVSNIEYVVSCPTATSVPEWSITGGDAPNTTSAVTIQNNVVSVGAGEDTTVSWATPTLNSVRCRKVDNTFEQALNSFKIRITSTGESNLSTSVESNSFQIDSDAPTLATNGIQCAGVDCVVGGVGRVQISGVSDTVTPVSSICMKFDDTTEPTTSDLCWRPLESMGVVPPSLNPATFVFENFISLLPFSGTAYFWTMDSAGNISSLSNSGTGTANQDMLDFNVLGTAKIANNDAQFFSSSDGLYKDSSSAENLTFQTAPLASLKMYAESDSNFANYVPDLNSVSIDARGRIFVKDAAKGLVEINTQLIDSNPGQNIKSVVIPKTGTFAEGAVGSSAPQFKNLKRHAIDAKGYHWFIDDGKLAYVDMNSATPTLEWVAGGGTDETSDDFADPKTLKINSSDNIDAYGVFVVLPNQWVVFSADDPALPLNPASGPRFKLRVYKHSDIVSERKVSTIYLSGSTVQGATDDLVPYSSLAVSYDPLRNQIGNITGRFCATSVDAFGGLDHCDSAKLIQFFISTNTSPQYLGALAKDSLMEFQYLDTTLYMMDVTKGIVSRYDSGAFQKLAGSTVRGTSYCQNMSVSSSCGLRLVDFKVLPTGADQVLLLDQNFLRIVEQGQVFSIYSAP